MSSARAYVVYGAGAVGGVIGAALWEAGHPVTLVARGRHLEAIQRDGLRVRSPAGNLVHRIPAVENIARAQLTESSTVFLTMKSQDTRVALEALATIAPPNLAVVCAQNGVDNERSALRLFSSVYGASVIVPATYLDPGLVVLRSSPVKGVIEIGRYPRGLGSVAVALAADLTQAGFAARAVEDVMRWKYAKLLSNVGNAVNAITGRGSHDGVLYERARAEALACYAAAGVDHVPAAEDMARRRALAESMSSDGDTVGGASSWQSLARGTGRIESDYLNGEIALLGRLHGVPTPVNVAVQRIAARMAVTHALPGSLSEQQVLAELDAVSDSEEVMAE